MKRALLLSTVVILLLALSPLYAVFAQDDEEVLHKLEIRNQTDQTVSLVLQRQDGPGGYVLSAGPGAEVVFTVREGAYSHTTLSCGESASGTLDFFQQVRLVFSPCPGVAPNQGEPSMEKVHIDDSPSGKAWLYQY